MKQDFDVIIVGAGMVGASAALALAQKGFQVAVIERQPLSTTPLPLDSAYDLRVSAISPSSQQLLSQLGVWPLVRSQRSCDYQHMVVWHEHGDSVMHFASEQIAAPFLGTIVENRVIQSALLQQLQGLASVTLLPQCEICAIEQSADDVSLHTADHQQFKAGLLIAADGRESSVRQLLRLPVISGTYHQTAIVANVSTELSHQQTAWQRFLSTGPLAFLPLSNGQSSIVWSADEVLAGELMTLADDDFMERLSAALEYRLGRVVQTSPRASFPLSWHSAERWLQGRVLLIGDAAHGVHPLAGQGVNLGFSDVALLGGLIQPGRIYERKQLRRFERQRTAETVTATHLFTALKLVYAQKSPLLCRARDIGMSLVENNLLLKRQLIQRALHNMT